MWPIWKRDQSGSREPALGAERRCCLRTASSAVGDFFFRHSWRRRGAEPVGLSCKYMEHTAVASWAGAALRGQGYTAAVSFLHFDLMCCWQNPFKADETVLWLVYHWHLVKSNIFPILTYILLSQITVIVNLMLLKNNFSIKWWNHVAF